MRSPVMRLILLATLSATAGKLFPQTSQPSRPARIVKVFPGKICYRPGEKASFTITLKNETKTEQRVRLACVIEEEVDTLRTINYRRRLDGGKEQYIVHLLNQPNKPNYDEKETPPPTQNDVKVSFNIPEGKHVEKVYSLRRRIPCCETVGLSNPPAMVGSTVQLSHNNVVFSTLTSIFYLNADTLERSRLDPKRTGEWVEVSLPELQYWDVVVFELWVM